MISLQNIALFCWLTFMAYWFISSLSVKPIRETQGWLGGTWQNLLLFVGFFLKFRDEEKVLTRHLSAQYLAYKQRTKALIPFIW